MLTAEQHTLLTRYEMSQVDINSCKNIIQRLERRFRQVAMSLQSRGLGLTNDGIVCELAEITHSEQVKDVSIIRMPVL